MKCCGYLIPKCFCNIVEGILFPNVFISGTVFLYIVSMMIALNALLELSLIFNYLRRFFIINPVNMF